MAVFLKIAVKIQDLFKDLQNFEFHLKSLFGKQINEWFCRTLSAKEEAGYIELYLTKFLNVFVLFLKTYLSKFYHVFVKHYELFGCSSFRRIPIWKKKNWVFLILLNVFFQVANCICLNLNIYLIVKKLMVGCVFVAASLSGK